MLFSGNVFDFDHGLTTISHLMHSKPFGHLRFFLATTIKLIENFTEY